MSGEKGAEQGRTDVTEVGTARFELATPRSQSECATRLRHVPSQASLAAPLSFLAAALPCRASFAR